MSEYPQTLAVEGGREDETRAAPVPEALNRNLRCCIPCRLVKTLEQFYEQGCENCTFLDMEGDRERIEDCTTTEFHVRIIHYILSFYIYIHTHIYIDGSICTGRFCCGRGLTREYCCVCMFDEPVNVCRDCLPLWIQREVGHPNGPTIGNTFLVVMLYQSILHCNHTLKKYWRIMGSRSGQIDMTWHGMIIIRGTWDDDYNRHFEFHRYDSFESCMILDRMRYPGLV